MRSINNKLIEFIRSKKPNGSISLHKPTLGKIEKEYLKNCIDSNFVSTAGETITQFENKLSQKIGIPYVVACSSGTAALHVTLIASGVEPGTAVLTQSLSFVATANAISYCGAEPIFIDIDLDTWSLSPKYLLQWLNKNAFIKNDKCYTKKDNKEVSCLLIMHTFGNAGRLKELKEIADIWKIKIVEDCAESLGSSINRKHVGSFGLAGCISFNGNKIITTGGGGAVITYSQEIYKKVSHISSTARIKVSDEVEHDTLGFNYRMPSLNAALGLAQLNRLDSHLRSKRNLAQKYKEIVHGSDVCFFSERPKTLSNYWLCTITFLTKYDRDQAKIQFREQHIETRPPWKPLHLLPMYQTCQSDSLTNTLIIYRQSLCLPSSPNF